MVGRGRALFTFVIARVLRRFPAYTSRHMARLAGRVTVDDVTTLRTTAYRYTSRAQSATRDGPHVSCGRARRTRPVQARATAALLARLAARHCAGSVHAHSTEERRASAAPIRPKASKKQLLAVVNGTRRPHTMNMMSAAKSKRASPVGVAGWTAEHGSMLHLQRFAPLRP